jgi:hypothetical protein
MHPQLFTSRISASAIGMNLFTPHFNRGAVENPDCPYLFSNKSVSGQSRQIIS